MLEQMLIKPAGHHNPVHPVHRPTADTRLVDLAEFCMDRAKHHSVDSMYHMTLNELRMIPFTIDEMHSLLLNPKLRSNEYFIAMGSVLSAAYNISPDPVIIYDLPIPLNSLGHQCSKLLINRNDGGYFFGEGSTGVVINNGQTHMAAGEDSTGIFLNAGSIGANHGCNGKGIIINDGDASLLRGIPFAESGKSPGALIVIMKEPGFVSEDEDILRVTHDSELFQFVRELEAFSMRSAADIIAQYGDNPVLTIKQRINELVEKEWNREGRTG